MEKIKLYTEKELKRIATISYLRGVKNMPSDIEFNIANAISIELPSEEKIIDNSPRSFDHGELIAFIVGAKWVIEQIKQQADERTI